MFDTPLNADLHCHSTFSDGTLTPEALAQRAALAGVQLWALTDHDEVSGLARAAAAAAAQGLDWLSGVEISVSFLHQTVHIVGLGFDPDEATLRAGLAHTRGGRERRAREMADDLARVGLPGCFEGALRYVGNPDLISRTHLARHLVERGACRDTHEVFRRFLTEGKPGYVPHRWANLKDALDWIIGAGGVAVLAHPARYALSATETDALLHEFIGHGGRAVEVVTGSHSATEAQRWALWAREFKLAASRGSDFHSPDESHTDLGALATLPSDLTPVWALLDDRIVRAARPTPLPLSPHARTPHAATL